jgi:hypothetical protein
VQRFVAACNPRQRTMKLKLQDVGQKVAHVRHVRGYVILGARVEVLLAPGHWRRNTLVFPPQFPPRLVVFLRRDLAGEHLPAPLIDY